jgi:hypothetical protein
MFLHLAVLAGVFAGMVTVRRDIRKLTPIARNGDAAALLDIGAGRRLSFARRDMGSPAIILEAGYRPPAIVWNANRSNLSDAPAVVRRGEGQRRSPRHGTLCQASG